LLLLFVSCWSKVPIDVQIVFTGPKARYIPA